jgi:hypothetical protein
MGLMLKHLSNIALPTLDAAVDAELEYIRKIGSNINLVYACSNLGAYEALLYIIKNREHGVPIYSALANITSNFSGPAGVNNRLKNLRKLGLLEERSGVKKSQICLAPTEKLLHDLGPILCDRHQGFLQR